LHARARHAAFGDARDAEIENLEAPPLIDHQVGRFDVAVDDSCLVRMREPGAQLGHQLQLLANREGCAPLDLFGERFTADVLHHDVRRALELARVVDIDDVGVVQRGKRAGLTREALAQVGRVEARVQHLDRDQPADLGVAVASQVTRGHTAGPDETLDLVSTDF
jgi:hypothetical protein